MLVQTNINNTRSDVAHLIKALADISREIDERLAEGGEAERKAFEARVKSLMEDVPDLPNFSRFHDASATTRRARRTRATCARPSSWPTTRRLRAREAEQTRRSTSG